MKKKLLLLLALVLLISCAVLASCDVIDSVTSKLPFGSKTEPSATDPFANVTFVDVSGTYDGEAKTMAVANLPAGAVVVYSIDGADPVPAVSIVDAGTYTVEAQMTSATGEVGTKTATMTIAKASYTLENPEQYFAAESTVPYDGAYHTPEPIAALPDGLSFMPDAAPIINPGDTATYNIAFAFSDPAMARNYNPPAGISGIKLSVAKATIDMSGVVFEDLTVPFDNAYHTIEITGVPDLLVPHVDGGDMRQGQYTVTVTFTFKKASDATYYELPGQMTATLTIGAGEVTLPNIFNDKTVAYSGNNLYPIVPGGIEGIASSNTVVKDADGEEVKEVILPGEYTVTVSFTVSDPDKYLTPDPITYTLTVSKAPVLVTTNPTWHPVGGWDETVGEGGYFVKGDKTPAVEITLPEAFEDLDVEITYQHTLNGVAVDGVSIAGLYTTTATITLNSDLYVLPEGYSAGTFTWLLSDKSVDADAITFADKTVTYDGNAHKLEAVYEGVEGILGATTVVTDANGKVVDMGEGFVNAGVYTVTVTFETDAAKGYAPLTIAKTLTIEKALIYLADVEVLWSFELTDGKAYLVYDGRNHVVTLNDATVAALEELGVTVTYEGNKAKAIGEYTAIANLACDDNHVLSVDQYEFKWQIAQEKWTDPVQ